MKIQLTFDGREELHEAKVALLSPDIMCALHDFLNQSLRKRLKYDNLDSEKQALLEELRGELCDLLGPAIMELIYEA